MNQTYYPCVDNLKYWTPEGFEVSSYKWKLSEKVNQAHKTS